MQTLDALAQEIYKEFRSDGITLDDAKEMAEMELKAKALGRTPGVYQGKPRGKQTNPREKKVDEIKKAIISDIFGTISQKYGTVIVKNDERQIDLTINGEEYTINLVKHRKKL